MSDEKTSVLRGHGTSPPEPHETLDTDEMTTHWLASAWSLEDIEEEWFWLWEDRSPAGSLGEIWLRPRWTTEAERADEDALYDLFGAQWDQCDTSVAYERADAESPGAHRYLTTEVAPIAQGQNEEGTTDAR
jgi:hypothetical protein